MKCDVEWLVLVCVCCGWNSSIVSVGISVCDSMYDVSIVNIMVFVSGMNRKCVMFVRKNIGMNMM